MGVFTFFQRNILSTSSLYFLGLVLYGLPLFYGRTRFVESYRFHLIYEEGVPNEIYYFFILAMCGGLFLLFFESNQKYRGFKESKKEIGSLLKFFSTFQFIYFLLFLKDIEFAALFAGEKSYFVQNSSVFYFFCAFYSGLLILCSIRNRNFEKKYLAGPVLFLLLDLYIGYRTNTFLLICSSLLLLGLDKERMTMAQKLKFSAYGGCIVVSAFVFKAIYYSIQVGGLSNLQFFTDTTLEGSEPFVILGNFVELWKQNYGFLEDEVLLELAQYLPFAKSLFEIDPASLNSFLQGQLFPKTEWGIASSGLGSLYFSFGILGIFLYLVLLIGFQFMMFSTRNSVVQLTLLLVAPYFFFYFHRNDWHAPLGTLKLVLISLVPYLVYLCSKSVVKEITGEDKATLVG